MSSSEKLKQEMKGVLSELENLADEVRLKAHLGGMEAGEAWQRLEPRLKDFEQRVESATDTMMSELRSNGADLRAALHDLRAVLGLGPRP